MGTSVKPSPISQDRRFSPVRPGKWEAVNEPLYDFQSIGTSVTGSYRFFSNPVGNSSKTLEDTNMVLSGQLPSGNKFQVRAIEVLLFPGVNPSVATGAPAASDFVNDVWKIQKAGYLTLTILAKPYLQAGPVGQFPATKRLDVSAALADSTTAGATQFSSVAYASMGGGQFQLTPVDLLPNMNFDVTLTFPTAITLSAAARIGVVLRGIKRRLSQ